MTWVLFVLLIGSDGKTESGWLPYPTEQACAIKRSWYLQRTQMSDGSRAKAWVVECMAVASD